MLNFLSSAFTDSYGKKHFLLYGYVGVMLSLLYVSYVMDVGIFPSLLLGLTASVLFWGNDTDILSVFMCLIPFSTTFQYKYAVLICMLALLIRHIHEMKMTYTLLSVVFMMVWELLHTIIGEFVILEWLRDFSALLFLGVLISCDTNNIDFKTVVRSLSIAVLGIGIIMLLTQINNFGTISDYLSSSIRFGQDNTDRELFGLNFNANGLGYICSLPIIGQLLLINNEESSLVDKFLLCLCVIFGSMTVSRTFLVCLVFIILYYLYAVNNDNSSKTRKVFTVLFLIVGLLYIVYLFFPQIIGNFIERFSRRDISNGRIDLFAFYNGHILSSPQYLLFGIGMQEFAGKLGMIYANFVFVCHNGLQEIWVAWGLFGVVLFASFIICLLKDSKTLWSKETKLLFLPLFLLLIYTSAGQLIRNGIALMSFSFVYLALTTIRSK